MGQRSSGPRVHSDSIHVALQGVDEGATPTLEGADQEGEQVGQFAVVGLLRTTKTDRHVLCGALWRPRCSARGCQVELAQDCPGMDKGRWGYADGAPSPVPSERPGSGASGVSVGPGERRLLASALLDLGLHKL